MQENKVTTELQKLLGNAGPASRDSGLIALVSGRSDTAESGTDNLATGGTAALAQVIARNTEQLIQVRGSLQGQLDSVVENTRALVENTAKSESAGSKAANVASSAVGSIFGGGILGPIISGLLGLFGGDDKQEPALALTKFELPAAVSIAAGVQGNSTAAVDYGQNDKPRIQAAQPMQVTVNVNAMDSRSFLDHSAEIAGAVRRALLESNALNDVIGEM